MKTFITIILSVGVIIAGAFCARDLFIDQTIEQLLLENNELKSAISNLNQENQIGYAKVLSQEKRDGNLYTRLLFVESDPSDPARHILKKEFEIKGDIIHFDTLIVKFGNQIVMNGQERALFLWRRIYGESMAPEDGLPIEEVGVPSPRYEHICEKLSIQDRNLFWSEIWQLANDSQRLKSIGVTAVYGNAVYEKVKPGLIYVFKISSTGTFYPDVVPDL